MLISIFKNILRSSPSEEDKHAPAQLPFKSQNVVENHANNERVIYESCPLCDFLEITKHLTGDCSRHPLYQPSLLPNIQWMKCSECGHIFTEGYFTQEACDIIFSRTNENQKLGYDFENQRMVSSRIVEKVLPYVSTGHWLDVGFGNGSLLFTAKEYGFVPVGTDLRVLTVSEMSSLGIKAYCAELDKLTLTDKCHVISMADVLEHTAFPRDYLKAAYRLLVDNGILFISMPNMESVVWQIYDQQGSNPYWSEIEHYHNFSRSRLYELLKEEGFEPVRYGISERYKACMEVISRKRV